jgi:hypothetical protein
MFMMALGGVVGIAATPLTVSSGTYLPTAFYVIDLGVIFLGGLLAVAGE